MLRLLLALALASLFSARAAAAPLEAYGGLPTLEAVEVSPDGTKLALVVSNGEMRGVVVRPLDGGESHTYGLGENKIRRLDWAGPEHLIITTSKTGGIAGVFARRGEYWLGYDLNLKTRKVRRLLERAPGRSTLGTHIRDKDSDKANGVLNILAGPPEIRMVDGDPTLFLPGISFPDSIGVLTMFKVDLKSGAPHFVEVGDRHTSEILLGQDGAPLAKSSYDAESGRWSLQLRQGGFWKTVRTIEAMTEPPSLVGLGRDGRSVVVAELGDVGFQMREVTSDGGWSEPLEVRDMDGPIFDPATHRLIGVHALVGDEDRYTFFEPQDQNVWAAVKAAFKGQRVLLRSWSEDRKKIVVLVDSPVEGAAYALVDLTTKTASWIGPRYGAIGPEDISPVRPVRFAAQDGLELSGYLTTPRGAEAKNLPLIVFPHGGPASRDTPGFDWWAQAMASRGYAVLQVNFRGSDGFGWNFVEAGFGEWGRKMQSDLSDGVAHLAREGVIDPKRVCIVGASYGGYAALAGATLQQGVYRCAVSVAGVSHLRRFVDWSRANNGVGAFRYWTRFMGAEASRDPALTEISPAAHAERANIPILLIHGRDDTVVPLEQSRIMADALEKAGKPVEIVVQSGADHWLSRGDTRLETLTATMAFVEKHNPPN